MKDISYNLKDILYNMLLEIPGDGQTVVVLRYTITQMKEKT